ncbi:DUF1801 domain-containing protein [bacterium]|nr:DUF1801 domain-containing protein [bacterium]
MPSARKTAKVSDPKEAVEQYLQALEHPLKAEFEAVRAIILNADGRLAERIKWNAPSYHYQQKDMAAFHPRSQAFVHLIFLFPDDMPIDDSIGILEGKHVGRREIKFHGMDDIQAKKPLFEKLVKDWVAYMSNQA